MHYKTGPASLATPTSSYRVALWIVVARVSVRGAHGAPTQEAWEGCNSNTEYSRSVTSQLSNQPTSILKFHRWTVFFFFESRDTVAFIIVPYRFIPARSVAMF